MDIDNWLKIIIDKLKDNFHQRLIFVGLQGSYSRGESTNESDIDLCVVLDELIFNDLKIYRSIIADMPNNDKACGFVSGKKELQNWSKSDLFQFYYDTKPLLGDLSDIITLPTNENIKQMIKMSSENLYHLTVHSFVHSNNYVEDLLHLYKSVFFILQAKYFIETNKYISTKKLLLEKLSGFDKEILDICINKSNIKNMNFPELERLYEILIKWTSANI